MARFQNWNLLLYGLSLILSIGTSQSFSRGLWYGLADKDAVIGEKEVAEMRSRARKMFQFGYDNYMFHAYPEDELDPIHCKGRGHDYDDE